MKRRSSEEIVKEYRQLIADLFKVDIVNVEFWHSAAHQLYSYKYIQEGAKPVTHFEVYFPEKNPEDNGTVKGTYYLCIKTIKVASFELYSMPRCCGILLSCNATVSEGYRNKGLGSLLNKMRKEISTNLGYTILLCTDRSQNEPQRKVLQKNEWEDIYKFKNKRTGNDVFISIIKT